MTTLQARAALPRALIAGAALLIVLRSGALRAAAPADDLQPGVQTSSAAAPAAAPATASATAPAAAPATAAPARAAGRASGQAPRKPGKPASGATEAGGTGTAPAAARPGGARDRVELDTTQITGNRELPNVMYVVPWKKPELGDFGGRPPKSLLDELLAPVDRDVFRRQNRYYSALKAGAAAGQGAAGAAAGGGAPGAAAAAPAVPDAVPNAVPNAVDEK